jgi:hypothetical protein
MNPFHDSKFLKWHSHYLGLAASRGIHNEIERAISAAP